MRMFEFSEFIARKPEDVFDFIVDSESAPRWRALVRRVAALDAGPMGVGSRIRVTFEHGGKKTNRDIVVSGYERPRRYQHRSDPQDGGYGGYFEYALEPEGPGTRVRFFAELRPRGLFAFLYPWRVARQHRERYENQPGRLKTELEAMVPWR